MRWHDDIFVMERPFKFQSVSDTQETFPLSPTKVGASGPVRGLLPPVSFKKTGAPQVAPVSMQET